MKKLITNKAKFTASITIVLLMISAFSLMLSALVQAQDEYENMQEGGSIPLPSGVTPDLTLETHPYLSFSPNPIGFGQTFLVNMWIVPPLHVSRYFSDYTITITKPSGQVDVVKIDSYRADATAWFPYVADEVGEWTLKFEFPGGYFPAGNYTIYAGAVLSIAVDQVVSFDESVYYLPSSTEEQTLTVQEDFIYSWPSVPLPTDYWTRPVNMENREWWPILGGYPGTGYVGGGSVWDELYPNTNPRWSSNYDFHPWIIAPDSAHIVWRRQAMLGGLTGGQAGYYGETTSAGTVRPSAPFLIYAGRAYDSYTDPATDEARWRCTDIRNGEVYWEKPIPTSTTIRYGRESISYNTPNIISYGQSYATLAGIPAVPGGEAGAGYHVDLLRISNGYLMKWDPFTGIMTGNFSISPLSSGTYYKPELVLSVQNLGGGEYRLINWTTRGTYEDITDRVISNTTYARSSLPSLIDWNVGLGATVSSITPEATAVPTQTLIRGYNLITGEELWNTTVNEAQYSGACAATDHGKVAVLMKNGYYVAYDLSTGNSAWTSEKMDYPWGESSFGAYAIQSAYGLFYRQAYDGVYAFNWADGTIAWKYEAPAVPFETPYVDENGNQVYSFNAGAVVVDGKLFTYNTEHTPSLPITRGWKLHCINATTGEGIWNITGPMSPGAVADGYLTASDGYDGYIYVFGKGQSETTVTAPDTEVPQGTSMMIKGSVLDLSPAQPGTPCVSAESMTTQMEYLHMQHPVNGLLGDVTITGVPVALCAIDSDGNYIDIGTATTEGYYGTFGLAWTPPDESTYKIIASFEGDDSYGSSGAATYVSVGPAPSPGQPETEEPSAEALAFPTTEVVIVAAVAVVAVVAIGVYWALRRRK
jgi:hypothetical protein